MLVVTAAPFTFTFTCSDRTSIGKGLKRGGGGGIGRGRGIPIRASGFQLLPLGATIINPPAIISLRASMYTKPINKQFITYLMIFSF